MSNDIDARLTEVRELYEISLAEHGVSSMGVGWRDDDSHRIRFDALARLIEGEGPFDIADLGCGYGAFHEYLAERSVPVSRFQGIDISKQMLAEAERRHPQCDWMSGSRLSSPADFAFACGIFNVRLKETEENWRQFIEQTLDNLSEFSTRGFAFNLLSVYVDFREDHLFYGDPCYFFDLCKRKYSRKVTLIHDYPLFEWTILVRK